MPKAKATEKSSIQEEFKVTQEKILYNSRSTVISSTYVPCIIGSLILSAVYSMSEYSIFNIVYSWIFMAMSGFVFYKYLKENKKIKEMSENGC